MEHIKIICPKCGKELEIPGELMEFSCLYCGERIHRAPADSVEVEEDLTFLREHLIETVTNYPDNYKKIVKQQYFSAFESYESGNYALMERMDRCLTAQPEALKPLISEFLDDIQAYWEADPRWRHKSQHNAMYFEVKVVLALFLTPLTRKLGLDCAEDFRQELLTQWKQRLPKEDWTPGDYETIAGGYRKRRWCFITTATCLHEGKSDDCAELTAFRAFRDGWLTQRGDTALIEEYYQVAPGIVAAIDFCDNSAERYDEIRTRWLEPCYRALQTNRPEICRELYVDMVQTLRQRYLRS